MLFFLLSHVNMMTEKFNCFNKVTRPFFSWSNQSPSRLSFSLLLTISCNHVLISMTSAWCYVVFACAEHPVCLFKRWPSTYTHLTAPLHTVLQIYISKYIVIYDHLKLFPVTDVLFILLLVRRLYLECTCQIQMFIIFVKWFCFIKLNCS